MIFPLYVFQNYISNLKKMKKNEKAVVDDYDEIFSPRKPENPRKRKADQDENVFFTIQYKNIYLG